MSGGLVSFQGIGMLAVLAAGLLCSSVVLAQVEVPLSETPAGKLKHSEGEDQITSEGVPTEAAQDEAALSEVTKAMESVEEEAARGLPAEFVIRFGDVFDWLRLTSGEWLKGNVKRMRDEEIEFDSDKLDVVTFDWEDVERLQSPGVNTYVFEGKLDVVGRAVVTKDKVIVETKDGVQEYPREGLLSIIEGAPRERNWWSSKLGAGLSLNTGNTDQGSLTAYFELVRADYRTRTKLRYDGTIGYANGEQNVNRHIGNAGVRLYISRRWYFTPALSQFLYDKFQNIRFRATPGTGAGVHLFDTSRWEWDVDAGLGYQYLEFLSTASDVKNPQSDGFVSFGTWANLELYTDIELEIEWRTNLVYTTIGNTNHTGRATLSIEITDVFEFETSFLLLRTEDPPPRADGTQPEKNDYQIMVGVALDIG
jgi:hypothetical protein